MEDDLLKDIEDIFKARGMTPAHGRVFATLLMSKEPITQKEIARMTRYSLPAVSLALDDLAKNGLVSGRKIQGKREKRYRVTGNLVKMFKNYLAKFRSETIRPYIKRLKEIKEKTPGMIKMETELIRFDRYIKRLLEVD